MNKELVMGQIAYFRLLSKVISEQVSIWEGQPNYFKIKRLYNLSQNLAAGKLITDRLRFNCKELIFDPDCSWLNVFTYGNRLIKYFQKHKIPYDLIYSGRNIRIHIYLKPIIAITQEDCFAMYCFICSECGLDWKDFGLPENKAKNHLLGVPGKKNAKTGYYATSIDIIPKIQPKTTLNDVKFSQKVSCWRVSEGFVEKAREFFETIPKGEIKESYSNSKYNGGLYCSKW